MLDFIQIISMKVIFNCKISGRMSHLCWTNDDHVVG